MIRSFSKTVLVMVACAGLMVSGCKSSTEKAADKNLSDMKAANKDVASTSIGEKTLPPECDAYITKVDTCVKKLDASNPMGAQFKQSMETARAGWANIPDKAALANSCKQANAAFDQMSTSMCK